MRVAAIYDIHGNLPALEAVLEEIRQEPVDQIVVGGDVVPGPMPRECLSALVNLSMPVGFVRGNGEREICTLESGRPSRVPKRFLEGMRWVAQELSAETVAAFASWPLTLRMEIPGIGDVLFCHATPSDDSELFTRLTPENHLGSVFETTGADLVVCGHTHMQFDRRIGNVRVVNAGSVGMPFGDPGAFWLRIGPGVELRHTTYDLEAATARIRATSYPLAAELELMCPPGEAEMLARFEANAIK